MNIRLLTFFVIALVMELPASAGSVKLCHIANAGFIAEGKNAAVLFDAARMRDEYGARFVMPSGDLMQDLTAGSGAFSKVKLALVSHRHNDHFDQSATLAHLRADLDVEYIMPPEAYDLLVAAGLSEVEATRVHSVLPPWEGGPVVRNIAGMRIEAYRVDHGPNRPQNVGYRVLLDGMTFFHTGDISASAESLRKAGLVATPVDVMLLAYWYGDADTAQNKAIFDAWEIGTTVPMHFAGAGSSRERLIRNIHAQWPSSVQLTSEMACHTFTSE